MLKVFVSISASFVKNANKVNNEFQFLLAIIKAIKIFGFFISNRILIIKNSAYR